MSTAFRRSSNSPRYFEPASSAPMSSAMTRRSRSDSGMSPATIRWARPSTIAVLPTPGSPMRTGLFFVRRLSTWMTRRISSSRPMTGSSLPSRAASREVAAVALERLDLLLGRLVGDAVRAAHVGERLQQALARRAGGAQRLAGGAVVAGEREQQVLDGDVLVLERRASRARRRAGSAGARATSSARPRCASVGSVVERGVDVGAQRVGRDADLAEHGRDEAALLVEQRGEQMQRGDLRVAARGASASAACRASWVLIVKRSACMDLSVAD